MLEFIQQHLIAIGVLYILGETVWYIAKGK